MPLVKKPNGWYWGSKGPFTSKTKALAVARAAYASGFKESELKSCQDDAANRSHKQSKVTNNFKG